MIGEASRITRRGFGSGSPLRTRCLGCDSAFNFLPRPGSRRRLISQTRRHRSIGASRSVGDLLKHGKRLPRFLPM